MKGSTNNLRKCNNQSQYNSNPKTKTNDFDNNDELIRCIGLPTYYSPPSQLLEKAPDAAVYRSASNSRQTTPENDKDINNVNDNSHPNSANTATHNSLHNTTVKNNFKSAINNGNESLENLPESTNEMKANTANNNETLSPSPTNANVNNSYNGSPQPTHENIIHLAAYSPNRNVDNSARYLQTSSVRDKLEYIDDSQINSTYSDTSRNMDIADIVSKENYENDNSNNVPVIVREDSTQYDDRIAYSPASIDQNNIINDNHDNNYDYEYDNNLVEYKNHLSIIEECRNDIMDLSEDDLCMFSRPLTPRPLTPHPYPQDLMPNPFTQNSVPSPRYKASLQSIPRTPRSNIKFRRSRGDQESDKRPPNLRKQPVLTQAHRDIIKKIQKRNKQQEAGSLYGYKSKPESKPNRSHVNSNRTQMMRQQRGKDQSKSPAMRRTSRSQQSRYTRVLSRTDSNLSLTNLRPKSHSRSLPNLNSCGIAPRQNNYRQIGRSMHQIPGRPTRYEQSTPRPGRYDPARRAYPSSKQGQLLSPSIVTTDVDWTRVSLAEVLSLIPVTKSQAILYKYGCHHTRR